MNDSGGDADVSPIRKRVANACDTCKARKVRCDGRTPCTYCARRRLGTSCHYSGPARQRRSQALDPGTITQHHSSLSQEASDSGEATISHSRSDSALSTPRTPTASSSRQSQSRRQSPSPPPASDHDETEVPREARLLWDSQGKSTFVGDCAPLSFFQTVRRLVITRVDRDAFAPQTSGYSILENVTPGATFSSAHTLAAGPPSIDPACIPAAVTAYLATTTVLVDLFVDNGQIVDDISRWAHRRLVQPDEAQAAVFYLVLAIGCLDSDAPASQRFFDHAKGQALGVLIGDLSIGTVQAFMLITLYMLMTCQINGAFMFFGIAVRAAYSIGLHRTEINSRFGQSMHRQRDRIWKSLHVIDLCLSTSMGRPPATSDVDCSVPYEVSDNHGETDMDVLNASVQIYGIIEIIVVDIYTRRKISSQLTEGISRRLRDWSLRWLPLLKDAVAGASSPNTAREANGSCQVLASYYYAVMLVSRPFLMYELHRRLSPAGSLEAEDKNGMRSGRTRLADACIDAASLMVEPILRLTNAGIMQGRFPSIVPWLFASSLVLGVGLLGGFGRVLEKHTRMAISALDHFAKDDTHAAQYSLIAKSLLSTAVAFLEKQEEEERARRTESSSQLFGLVPNEPIDGQGDAPPSSSVYPPDLSGEAVMNPGGSGPMPEDINFGSVFGDAGANMLPLPDAGSQNLDFFSDLFDLEGDQEIGASNLFPLLDGGGHIDLAHHF